MSDKDLENYFNDHTGKVEAPKATSAVNDKDLEAYFNDTSGKVTLPADSPKPQQDNVAMSAIKQIGSTMMGDREHFAQPVSSNDPNMIKAALMRLAQPFQGALGPSRLSATISAPGQAAGEGVTTGLNDLAQNLNQGKPPSKLVKGVNSVIGFADSLALDPQNYVGEGLAKLPVVAGEKIIAKAGKEVAALGSAVSGVKLKDGMKLFNSPMDVLSAPSLKTSGKKMGEIEKFLGVSDDEARLIAKAADRASGASRSVVEQVMKKGKELAVEAGDTSEAWAKYLTPGELIAGRRGASKLTSVAKGRDLYQATKDLRTFEDAFVTTAKDKAVQYLKALKDQSNAHTRDAFTKLVPRGVTGKPDFFRTLAAGATGLATSPAAVGLMTLGSSAAHSALAPIARAATGPLPRNTVLSVLRNHLMQQQQPQ